jgi:hypothetical protein
MQNEDAHRRRFSQAEDDLIRQLILRYGEHDWNTVAGYLPTRTARQCRHRYYNYLLDTHQPIAWTDQEDRTIIDKYRVLGPRWASISRFLVGRTGNDVKNRWHKHISKKMGALDPVPPRVEREAEKPADFLQNIAQKQTVVLPGPEKLAPYLNWTLNERIKS